MPLEKATPLPVCMHHNDEHVTVGDIDSGACAGGPLKRGRVEGLLSRLTARKARPSSNDILRGQAALHLSTTNGSGPTDIGRTQSREDDAASSSTDELKPEKLTRRKFFDLAKKYGPGAAATVAGLGILATIPDDSPLGTLDTLEPAGRTDWSFIYPFGLPLFGEQQYVSLFVGDLYHRYAMSASDVSQSRVTGDCGLMALLVAAAMFMEKPMTQQISDNGHGVFSVTLYRPYVELAGQANLRFLPPTRPETYTVSLPEIVGPEHACPVFNPRSVPDVSGRPRIAPVAAIWPLVVEAAMAQYLGGGDRKLGFDILARGTLNEGVERMAFALTGREFVGKGLVTDIENESETDVTGIGDDDPIPSWSDIGRTMKAHGVMMLATGSARFPNLGYDVSVPDWFVPDHFFAVVGCHEDKQTRKRMVEIVNPWGLPELPRSDEWRTSVPYDTLKTFFRSSVFERPQ